MPRRPERTQASGTVEAKRLRTSPEGRPGEITFGLCLGFRVEGLGCRV